MRSRTIAEGDLAHFWVDTWGITEASIVWQGKFLQLQLRIETSNGCVDIDIIGHLGRMSLAFVDISLLVFKGGGCSVHTMSNLFDSEWCNGNMVAIF